MGKENTYYYDLLNISPDADQKEILAAFRRIKQACELKGQKFLGINAREITTAYEILSDPEKRRAYDEERKKPVKTMEQINEEMDRLSRELEPHRQRYTEVRTATEIQYIPLDEEGKELLRQSMEQKNQQFRITIALIGILFFINLIRILFF